MSLAQKLASKNIHDVAAWLDAMTHAQRMEALGSTSKAEQAALWDLSAASAPLDAEYFVPSSVPDTTEVIHHGRNSLPVFRMFQKRMARAADGSIFGYNEGGTRPIIGPGYFVLHATAGNPTWEERGAMVVDYFMTPAGPAPAGWPGIRANHVGLQVVVYHHTRDFMRRVSNHVTIGRAFKNESDMRSFFTLIREDR